MPSGYEWFIILGVVLLIFGGSQLPKLAKNIGKAQKEFKDGLAEGSKSDADKTPEELAAELATARAEAAEAKAQAAVLRAETPTPTPPVGRSPQDRLRTGRAAAVRGPGAVTRRRRCADGA